MLFIDGGRLTPVLLYDVARLVEDFVLTETLIVPNQLRYIMTSNLQEHDPAVEAFIKGAEDFLYEKFYLMHPELNRDVEDSTAEEAEKTLREVRHEVLQELIKSPVEELSRLTEQDLEALLSRKLRQRIQELERELLLRKKQSAVRALPHLFDDQSRSLEGFEFDKFVMKKIGNPLALSSDKWTRGFVQTSLSHFQLSVSPGVGFINVVKEPRTIISRELYSQVDEKFKVDVSRVHRVMGTHHVYTPPLLTILLDRCRTRQDLPQQLCRLRAEFSDLRETLSEYETELRQAESLSERLGILEELEEGQRRLAAKISKRKHKSLVRRVWDIIKPEGVRAKLTKAGDAVIERIDHRHAFNRAQRFVDIYELATSSKSYPKSVLRVLGANRTDEKAFARFDQISQAISKAYKR